MKILVFGKTGQLARALRGNGDERLTIISLNRDQCDLAHLDRIEFAIAREDPDAVINAAAYTAVDKAEGEPALAMALNGTAPAAISAACKQAGLPLVHVSTDYVFDGLKTEPYGESDPVAPQSVYGRSKAAGEDAVLGSGANAAIIRTSWVYSAQGSNFVRTMLSLAATRDEISVIADQVGRPTWASDLARACLAAAQALAAREKNASGVFHYSGAGDATWADFAEAIFAEAAKRGLPSARVRPVTTAEYPTAAKRPPNSRLDTRKIEQVLGVPVRPWRDALALCMDEIAAHPA